MIYEFTLKSHHYHIEIIVATVVSAFKALHDLAPISKLISISYMPS